VVADLGARCPSCATASIQDRPMSCECACHRLGVESIEADCPCNQFRNAEFKVNSLTVIAEAASLVDNIPVWYPEAVINLKRPEDPASP
jgi:hypothetical protein